MTLYFVNPTTYWFWPKCPFKLLTGLSCPACGIQRFIHAMTNGHFREAIAYNYFLVYALPYIVAIIATFLMPASRLKELMQKIFENKFAIWLYIATFCAWFAIRNILKI